MSSINGKYFLTLERGEAKHIGISFNGMMFDLRKIDPRTCAKYRITFFRKPVPGYVIITTVTQVSNGWKNYESEEDLGEKPTDLVIQGFYDEEIDNILCGLHDYSIEDYYEEFTGNLIEKHGQYDFVQRAYEEGDTYISNEFFGACLVELNNLRGDSNEEKRYKELIDVVYTFFEPTLFYISVRILCDCGMLSTTQYSTSFMLETHYRSFFAQCWDFSYSFPFFGNLFIDPVLRTIQEKNLLPLTLFDNETQNNLKIYVTQWLNSTPVKGLVKNDPKNLIQ